MSDFFEDAENGVQLIILIALAIAAYFVYQYLKNPTCLNSIFSTKCQRCAPQIAAGKLKAGGKVIWSCGQCFDYQQPCGMVTEVRASFWGQLTGTPVTYTCVPAACYHGHPCTNPMVPCA